MPPRSRLGELATSTTRAGTALPRSLIVSRYGQTAFDQAVRRGILTPVIAGIYSHVDHAGSFATRIEAVNHWMTPSDAISGRAACALHGMSIYGGGRITVVRGDARSGREPKWVRLRRLKLPLPTTTISGVRIVTLPHSLVQAWWDEGNAVGMGLILDAIRERRVEARDLAHALASFPRVGGRAALVEFLNHLRGGVHSYLEYLADRDVFDTPDLRNLKRQRRIWVEGQLFVVDVFDEETQTAFEFDGARYHSDDRARRRDLARDGALATIGVAVVRFTFEDVSSRPAWCRDRVRKSIASRKRFMGSIGTSIGPPSPISVRASTPAPESAAG